MEPGDAGRDTSYYNNINETRNNLPYRYPTNTSYSDPNERVAKVSGSGNKIGPAITLKVMAGDQFSLRVSSWYKKERDYTSHAKQPADQPDKRTDRFDRQPSSRPCHHHRAANK